VRGVGTRSAALDGSASSLMAAEREVRVRVRVGGSGRGELETDEGRRSPWSITGVIDCDCTDRR